MRHFLSICILVLCTACSTQDDKKSIAILLPMTHPSMEQCEKGFIETMEQSAPGKYRFVTYNAQGNKTLLRSEVEEIAQRNIALVLTVGTTTTQMATEVFAKKTITIPIVFTAVNITENFTGVHVTGVKELLNFDEEIASLLIYKPNVKKVLLVYNPAEPGLQKDVEEINSILRKRSIALGTVEVFQTNELKAKVSPFIANADAILVLKDHVVVAGLEVLCKLCNEKHIPLMTSDLDSPDRGAAFGYGVREFDFGVEAAKKALQILEEGVTPSFIPVTPVGNFTLRINREAAAAQGIEVHQ